MTAQPQWSAVDDATADLLALVADEGHPSVDYEWDEFVNALRYVADADGICRPNALRPLLRGVVAPKRIGAFVNRALAAGLIEPTGEWQTSNDAEGRNAGRPARVYRLKSPQPRAG